MCLYRFHVRDSFGLLEDEEGLELPDLLSVFKEAQRSIREFSADAVAPTGMCFEITDDKGSIVLMMPIGQLSLSKRPVTKVRVHRPSTRQTYSDT